MKIVSLVSLTACLAVAGNTRMRAAAFADRVVSYQPGVGFATDFVTKAGITNPASAIGEPARITPGEFGGPVDPFNPAYLGSQIVSLGKGGSLTVHLASPAQNAANNPYGVDFVIYGNSGFIITNGDFSGGGKTDGSVFAANPGGVKVSVSTDGSQYYDLTPSLSPIVDGLFPTDGSGMFGLPANPALNNASFNGKDLAGIRALYGGSAGGTGYDLDWARDGQGTFVKIDEINYVRVDVLNGNSEFAGFATAVPEPAPLALGTIALAGLATLGLRRRN